MSRQELAAAIAAASVAVGPDTVKDDLTSHFTFRAGPGGIDLLTYNRVCHVLVPIKGTSTAEGCFSLEAKRLQGCLRAALGDEIQIHASLGCSELRVGTWSASIRGLPTTRFPFWDEEVRAARSIARIKVGRLALALSYISKFAEQEDTKQPALCAVYGVSGRLQATDIKSAAYVDIPELDQADFRLHINAVQPLLRFIQRNDPAEEIEALAKDRHLYLRRADGAVFGCQMLAISDPALQSPIKAAEPATLRVSVSLDEIRRALSFLDSVTSEMEFRVGVRVSGSTLRLSMRGEATSQDEVVEMPATLSGKGEVVFSLPRSQLKRVLGQWEQEQVGIEVVQLGPPKEGMPPSGYIRLEDPREGMVFWTLLSWIKR